MSRRTTDCADLYTWLRGNLGRSALGALTGTDDKALSAAVHILRLYAYNGHASALEAFRLVVLEMQPTTRELAYHAIAYVSEWHFRPNWWYVAGLPPLDRVSVCAAEPGGSRRKVAP
jgi:hypothetical protein